MGFGRVVQAVHGDLYSVVYRDDDYSGNKAEFVGAATPDFCRICWNAWGRGNHGRQHGGSANDGLLAEPAFAKASLYWDCRLVFLGSQRV